MEQPLPRGTSEQRQCYVGFVARFRQFKGGAGGGPRTSPVLSWLHIAVRSVARTTPKFNLQRVCFSCHFTGSKVPKCLCVGMEELGHHSFHLNWALFWAMSAVYVSIKFLKDKCKTG